MNRITVNLIILMSVCVLMNRVAAQQGSLLLQPGVSPPPPSTAPPTFASYPEPKHVLVVWKLGSDTSRDIKNAYVAARSIPAVNVVELTIPDSLQVNGSWVRLKHNKQEIWGEGNTGWTYYASQIASQLEEKLSTRINADGDTLKNVIRYIVFCKKIPHRIFSNPYVWDVDSMERRKTVSVDALACLLFQNVLSLYRSRYWMQGSPYWNVDGNLTLDYRFKPNHFVNASGWKLSYLVSRLDGDNPSDVSGMIQRSLQPDMSGDKWWVMDDDPCVGVWSYMQESFTKLQSLGFTNLNPTPFVNTINWITNNGSGIVMGYTSFGNNAGRLSSPNPPCYPNMPRMPQDYVRNLLTFQYAAGAMFNTLESFNGYSFSGENQGQALIQDFVHMGGTGGECHVFEPFAYTIALDHVFLPAYAMGYTLVDAAYQSIPYIAWQSCVVGDPLVSIARGKQTLPQNQTWSGANLVTGKVTVPAGRTLTIASGAALKFMPNAELYIEGQLIVNGTQSQPATFNAFKAGTLWKGINIITGSGSSIQYANINNAVTGVRVSQTVGANISHCTITGGYYGVFLFSGNSEGVPNPTIIQNDTIKQSAVAAIYVDVGASLPIIQNNVLQGQLPSLIGNYGMVFINSSPLLVLGNKVSNFGNAGIYCYNASPSFVDGLNGGHNCSYNNYGAGVLVESKAFPVFGNLEDITAPGYNTFANNQNYQMIVLESSEVLSEDNFYRDPEPIPSIDFSVDGSSVLYFLPFQTSDPNGCVSGGNSIVRLGSGEEKEAGGDDPPLSSPRNPLVKQAVVLRIQGQHIAAIALLKNILANAQATADMKVFAVHELLANYQRIANPTAANRLSVYLRNVIPAQSNVDVKRAFADVLATTLRHESDITAALTALDDNVRLYPNTSSKLLALYGKVSLALNTLNDLRLAKTSLQAMETSFPTAKLTKLAAKLVESAENMAVVSSSMNKGVGEITSSAVKSLPKEFGLEQNYPNPFNPTTNIKFHIPVDEHISLRVFTTLGEEVATIVNEARVAGTYTEKFDASRLASGVYIYRLTAGNFTQSKKFLLVK